MYKDNAVGNVVAEMGRDLVFMTTARLSDLALDCEKSTVLYAFSNRGAHVCLRGDWVIRGRGKI